MGKAVILKIIMGKVVTLKAKIKNTIILEKINKTTGYNLYITECIKLDL